MKSAMVQSVLEFAMREINALEQRIVKAEDGADAMLWEQAEQVVKQLASGVSQRELAAQWIHARTGKPYAVAHVNYTAKAYRVQSTERPRPRFRDVYNEIANAAKKNKLAVHHSSDTPEHYTPQEFLALVWDVFSGIPDLDPCSNSGVPHVKARRHYTAEDDGLSKPWKGRVFMNPPYGQEIAAWTEKARTEWERGEVTELIALLPARPDTEWFEALTAATDDAVLCFLNGRLTFVGNTASAPFPSLAIYFGPHHDRFAAVFAAQGSLWQRPGRPLEWFVSHEVQP